MLAVLAATLPATAQELKTAVFAGGCFWCMEPPFDELDGVVATTSGYTGGRAGEPDLRAGHLRRHGATSKPWRSPTTPRESTSPPCSTCTGGTSTRSTISASFCDKGSSYRAAIFVGDDEEMALAERTKRELEEKLGARFVTRILPRSEFYDAEDYHQDYYLENPISLQVLPVPVPPGCPARRGLGHR